MWSTVQQYGIFGAFFSPLDHRSSFWSVSVCNPRCGLPSPLYPSAVKYLHDKGITHRDIKLENILRSASGPHKLCDFGSCVQVRPCGRPDLCFQRSLRCVLGGL